MLDTLKESPEHVSGWFGRARRFLIEVRAELSRVTWPTRREVWATTLVVIVISVIIGVYLYAWDLVLSWLVTLVFESVGS